MASAMIERAELPVHRNRTLKGSAMSALCLAASRTRLRHGLRGSLRLTAHLFVRDARATLSGAVAILRALARGEERFPGDAGRIVDPRFFGLGITTGRLPLLDDLATGLAQARIDVAQFVLAFDLDAEMIEPRPFAARRDREIHSRVVQHPFGIVDLDHAGLGGEE